MLSVNTLLEGSTLILNSQAVILDPAFRQGEATTSYVEDFLSRAPKEFFQKKIIGLLENEYQKQRQNDQFNSTISEESVNSFNKN